MYEKHPACKYPDDENCKIWRYINFQKFLSLLQNQSLYFTIGNKLKEQDQFEGTYTDQNFHDIVWVSDEAHQSYKVVVSMGQDLLFFNCWSMNENESNLMWNNYLKGNDGIAIQSTVKKLKDSFTKTTEGVSIGMIDYIDYEKEKIPEGNAFYPFFHKRLPYREEHEIRVVNMDATGKFPEGKSIKVDLNTLIEQIYLAPNSIKWFNEIKLLMKKYELQVELKPSKLSENPLFKPRN